MDNNVTTNSTTETITEKLKEHFAEELVFKNQKSNLFNKLALPSFLKDWILKKLSKEDGTIDEKEVTDFVYTYIPPKEQWEAIKDRIINEGEYIKILTKISVSVSIKDKDVTFELPNYQLKNTDTVIEPSVWKIYKDALLSTYETWGVVELGYLDKEFTNGKAGKIKLVSFNNFCPYNIEIDYYKRAREKFSIEEWVDVLLGAIDYNAAGFETIEQKLTILTRLLPFIEERVNLLELAPKGTGKSYMFDKLSKHGVLIGGGKVTRPAMFYNIANNKDGYIVGNDFVAIDEISKVQFSNNAEIQSAMQEYMESGAVNVNGHNVLSTAGVVFLGNIEEKYMDENKDILSKIPQFFKDTAFLSRIHGFIKGWDIPAINEDMKITGWALNCEYFMEILHTLRQDITYRAIVDKILTPSRNANTRHTEAVKKCATAYLKLLFPNVQSKDDISRFEFITYCLTPAIMMRKIILKQMQNLDTEFCKETNLMPDFTINLQ